MLIRQPVLSTTHLAPAPKPKPPTKPEPPKPPVVQETFRYRYIISWQNQFSDWGPWSAWSTNRSTTTNLRQVESREERYISRYDRTVVGYDRECRTITTPGTTDTQPARSVETAAGYWTDWAYQNAVTTTNQLLYSSNTVRYTLYV